MELEKTSQVARFANLSEDQLQKISTGVNKEYKRSNNDAGMTVQSRLNVMNQVRLGNYFKMGD